MQDTERLQQVLLGRFNSVIVADTGEDPKELMKKFFEDRSRREWFLGAYSTTMRDTTMTFVEKADFYVGERWSTEEKAKEFLRGMWKTATGEEW